jgi:hypothetical protein
MAAATLDIYRDGIAAGATEMRPLPADPFGPARVARSVDESRDRNDPAYPCVIVSASGMATGGRVVHHLAGWPRTHVISSFLPDFKYPAPVVTTSSATHER